MVKGSSSSIRSRGSNVESASSLLLEAAKKLFSRKGFAGTSVRDISDEAGVNLSLVSYHFGGKEGLYQACMEKFGASKLSSAERILKPTQSTEELCVRLRMFFEEMFLDFVNEPELTRMIHRDLELDTRLTQDVFKKSFLRVFETLKIFFESAKRSGSVNKKLDPHALTVFVFSILAHVVRVDALNQRYFGQSIREAKYREHLIDQVLMVVSGGILSGMKREAP